MFAKLFDMVPSWLWATLLALSLATNVGLKLTVDHTQVKLAKAGQDLSDLKAAHEKAARELSEKDRKIETQRANHAQEINDAVTEERSKTAAAERDGDDVRRMLIDATRRFAARDSGSVDPAALQRAEERTATLGQLLGQCDQVAANLGRDAEGLATQVRGLQRSYASLITTQAVLLWSPQWQAGWLGDGVGSSPVGDGVQVHPHVPALGRVEVDATLPVLALDAGADSAAGLFRQ